MIPLLSSLSLMVTRGGSVASCSLNLSNIGLVGWEIGKPLSNSNLVRAVAYIPLILTGLNVATAVSPSVFDLL